MEKKKKRKKTRRFKSTFKYISLVDCRKVVLTGEGGEEGGEGWVGLGWVWVVVVVVVLTRC